MLGFQGDGTKTAGIVVTPGRRDMVVTGVGQKMTGQVKVSGSCTLGNPC